MMRSAATEGVSRATRRDRRAVLIRSRRVRVRRGVRTDEIVCVLGWDDASDDDDDDGGGDDDDDGETVSRGFARDDDARARERRGDGETGAQGDHRQ